MNVSGWTIEQRMRFPDWCFGNREVIGVSGHNFDELTYKYYISEVALPDPVCIWQFVILSNPSNGGIGTLRVGLADNVPVNNDQMDAATEILPYFGTEVPGPNRFTFATPAFVQVNFMVRKGMATDGKKIVISVYASVGKVRFDTGLVVSSLPTRMAGWLAHDKV